MTAKKISKEKIELAEAIASKLGLGPVVEASLRRVSTPALKEIDMKLNELFFDKRIEEGVQSRRSGQELVEAEV